MNGIYLLLGTNMGDKTGNLARCAYLIENQIGKIVKCSRVYKTAPWGTQSQNYFLNQVLKVKSDLSPNEILRYINTIEKKMGRTRNEKWEDRIIDLDLLYFDELCIDTEQLHVPHPQIQNRLFTLIPLCEIAPNLVHPKLKKTNKQLLLSCKDDLFVEVY